MTVLSRLEGTQWVTGGWISHILQRLVWTLLIDDSTASLLRKARRAYRERRTVLVDALASLGIVPRMRTPSTIPWREGTLVEVRVVARHAQGLGSAAARTHPLCREFLARDPRNNIGCARSRM